MKQAHRTLVTASWLGLGLATITFSTQAMATSRFPASIYYHLYPSYTVPPYQPPCRLCHLRGSTGSGTAQTPFALSMKARGLVSRDTTALVKALDAMSRDRVDSDNDGVTDIQEIEDDTDPNTPADVSLTGEPGPNAGCGGSQKGNTGGRPPASSALGVLGSILFARFRRRGRPS
jgi:hypothetical protein